MKDSVLIQKCKKNDYASQMEVYNSYKDMLLNSCWRLLKNRQDAEDMVHDAFVKGFQKIHQVKLDANLGAWLKRIAINCSLDLLRKRKQLLMGDVDVEVIDIKEEENERSEISAEYIKSCIAMLKQKYSVILILYMIEDYTHKEIAGILQLKESTVRNQYRRGKKQLLELIQLKQVV